MKRLQPCDDPRQFRAIGDDIAVCPHQIVGAGGQRCLNRHPGCRNHRRPQLGRQHQIADPAAFRLDHHRAGGVQPDQCLRQPVFEQLLAGLASGTPAKQAAAMVGQPLQINHLQAARRQFGQDIGLGGAGIAIQHHHRAWHCSVLQGRDHQRPPRLVAARNRINPPADLRQNGGERAGPLPAAPAIDQGPPAARLVGQRPFQMPRHIARHQRPADLAGGKGADLLVNRANPRPFGIIQHRQADRPRQMILGIFGRGAGVDDRIEAGGIKIAQTGQGQGHAR